MLFFGLFRSFGIKNFFENFSPCTPPPSTAATNYWRTPLLPFFFTLQPTIINCCHPSPSSTTDAPHCCHQPWTMVSCAVADAGDRWHQWWLALVGGCSGYQRWRVGGVGWQWRLLVATVVLGCNSRYGHRVLLDSESGLSHPTPPPKKEKEIGLKWLKMV